MTGYYYKGIPGHEMRKAFSSALSDMYKKEMPLYVQLVEAVEQTNAEFMATNPDIHIENIDTLNKERHGAIRVPSMYMKDASNFFRVLDMHPVGVYDFRDLPDGQALPILCTGHRPITTEQLAINPFRMFTSAMDPKNTDFFPKELGLRLEAFFAKRPLFSPSVLDLIQRFECDKYLSDSDAHALIEGGVDAFRMPEHAIPKSLYDEVGKYADIARDLVVGTQLNHNTPRTLDIFRTRQIMLDWGIPMLKSTQGPVRNGDIVQLYQDSFLAPKLPVIFELDDGSTVKGEHTARFGEMEQRGAALTPKGRQMLEESGNLPKTYSELEQQGLIYCTYQPTKKALAKKPSKKPLPTIRDLVDQGYVTFDIVVYEDFLRKSARNIFDSTISQNSNTSHQAIQADNSAQELENMLGRPAIDPDELYANQSSRSIIQCFDRLGIKKNKIS